MSFNKRSASLRSVKPKIKPSGPSKAACAVTPRLKKGEKESVPLRYVFENTRILLPKILLSKDTINEIRPTIIESPNISHVKGNIYAIIFRPIQDFY